MFISIDAFYDYLVNKGSNLKFSKDDFGGSFVAVGLEGLYLLIKIRTKMVL